MLQALKCHLQGEPFRVEGEPDWCGIFREAWIQSVTLPLFDAVQPLREQIPQVIWQVAEKQARKLAVNNMQISYAQQNLTHCLEQAGIEYVILKGEASAMYWPKPELRQLGDVDFIVPKDSQERTISQLLSAGYSREGEENGHHIGLLLGRVHLELHTRLAGRPHKDKGQLVDAYMQQLYTQRKTAGSCSVPSDEHQAVILLLHMQHHLIEQGIGLRHVFDWAGFMDRTRDAAFWEEKTLPLLKRLGLMRFTAALTKMTAVYFGSDCPKWAQNIPDSLAAALMEDILAGGNFGRKNAERSRSANMMPSWEHQDQKEGKLKMLYRTLKRATVQTHPKLVNKPVRRFFAMIGKAVRFLCLRCVGKRPSLLKAASHVDERRNLYDQLEIYD